MSPQRKLRKIGQRGMREVWSTEESVSRTENRAPWSWTPLRGEVRWRQK
jgi:hypothetical protein